MNIHDLQSRTTCLLDGHVRFECPITQTNEYLDMCKDFGLKSHTDNLIFTQKCEIAKKNGLESLSENDIVSLLVHHRPVRHTECCGRWLTTTFYDGEKTQQFILPGKVFKPKWFCLRYWQVKMISLDQLPIQIPFGDLQRMQKVKKTNFFNCFFAFTLSQKDPDCPFDVNKSIIVATIYERKPSESNRHSHFFVTSLGE